MSNSEVLKRTLQLKYWIIVISLGVGLVALIYNLKRPVYFTSKVSFFIDDDEAQGFQFNENDRYNITLAKAINGNRIYHLAKSSEIYDYLIAKFDLYKHYHIDSAGLDNYSLINFRLSNSISIQPTQFNAITIEVKDKDKYMAANIANEIFQKLDIMNRDFVVTNVERKMKIYNQLLDDNKRQSLEQANKLSELIEQSRILLSNKNRTPQEYNLVTDLAISISSATSQLSDVNKQLSHSIEVYELAASTLRRENLPNLRLINKALPEILPSPFISAVLWSIGFAFIALLIVTTILVFNFEYETHLKNFIK